MTTAPAPIVNILTLQDRRNSPRVNKPWIVRWKVDGELTSRSFDTKIVAEDFRSRLLIASRSGERFDKSTSLPVSWSPVLTMSTFEWAQQWVAENWDEWSLRTRDSEVEGLKRFLPLLAPSDAPVPPQGLRSYLDGVLRPDNETAVNGECDRWLRRWMPRVSDLTPHLLATVSQRIAIGDSGQKLAERTTSRWLTTSRACINRAVVLKVIERNPWPAEAKARKRRKSVKKARSKEFDVRLLPARPQVLAVLDAQVTHQPASRMYRAMTATIYLAGLRPSEIVDLPGEHTFLPEDGWGWIDVSIADVGFADPEESGEPKTGKRLVPIPPALCAELRSWITFSRWESGPLFRTRVGNRPSASNWNRSIKLACAKVGCAPMYPYLFRHACATFMLRSGVPIGEAARRLGHTVETLTRVYVGVLDNDETYANARLDAALADDAA